MLDFLKDRFGNALHADKSQSGQEGDLRTLESVFGIPAFGQSMVVFFRAAGAERRSRQAVEKRHVLDRKSVV